MLDKLKVVRYYLNHEKLPADEIYEELKSWPRPTVEKIIAELEKENQKPKPKRYYVSLKEPLEDSSIR